MEYVYRFLRTVANMARRVLIPFLLRRGKACDRRERVIRISHTTVVKCLPANIGRAEVATQRLVASQTSIPVPDVYDSWTTGDTTYIVMKYVEGQKLRFCWKKLSAVQKKKIATQLGQYLTELRSIDPPNPTYIGRVLPREPLREPRLSRELFGPFDDEKLFVDWRIARQEQRAGSHLPDLERLRKIRPRLRTDHRIVLTHGDLGPHNILVQLDGPGVDDVRIVAVIDWEMSGWMPEHWEYVKFMEMARFEDLRALVNDILPDYRLEEELEEELYSMMPLVW